MVEVTCSQCGIRILVPTTVQGRTGICFGCGASLEVPDLRALPNNLDLAFAVGDRISSRYIIEERLGEGGMGVVYRARDTLVNEEVALKFMKPLLLRTKEGQFNFIQEAQIARRLRHENIVAVHDIGWTPEGILYLSMEFLKGQSLRALLRKHRQDRKLIDVRLGVNLVAQILAALDHAHRTVVHRDVKPENIMILPGEQVKVLDFGLAKAVHEGILDEHLSGKTSKTSSRVAGTFAYAAPEQKKHRAVDLRADVYAVGLVFYELLTLRTSIDPPIEVMKVRNDVSPSLLAVLNQGLAVEKADRWQSAGEFRQRLLDAFEQSYRQATIVPAGVAEGATVSTEDMVYLEGGSFLMGDNGVQEEAPEFEAYIEPFYMDEYPVTVKQYGAFLEATGHRPPRFWHYPHFNGPSQPVVGVSWDDANAYAAWAGKQLPAEVQWEFAARGKENRKYPWGNAEPDNTRCNFRDNLSMPSLVTMYKDGATPEGIHDLAGNVYEWTLDPFLPYGPSWAGRVGPPQTPLRVVRGGSWNSDASELRSSHRKGIFPESQWATVGFRCVLPARAKPNA
jgi:serine/threonine-protein kinase